MRTSSLNPALAWLSSQNGLVADRPQRHSRASTMRLSTVPSAAMISMSPVTLSGPSI
jgi:hypothetical protein